MILGNSFLHRRLVTELGIEPIFQLSQPSVFATRLIIYLLDLYAGLPKKIQAGLQ